MKYTVCPYCGKTMLDNEHSFRFRCQYCKEYLIDIDKEHCRPDTNWKEDEKNVGTRRN